MLNYSAHCAADVMLVVEVFEHFTSQEIAYDLQYCD